MNRETKFGLVPNEFCKGESPKAHTVGELISQLNRLPTDLPIENGFSKGCRVVVYNIKTDKPHLCLDEID